MSEHLPLVSAAPRPDVIVIGASAGAVDALSRILPQLPATLPVPVLMVVHVPASRRPGLPELFRRTCVVVAAEAEDKLMPEPATV